MTKLKQASGTTSSFNKFMATPIDFSAFIMNRLNIQNLTQDLLTSPTYDLIKGTCKGVVELEYHLEEVFKATNDQLDWHNPEGRPYPHDLSKPLPLIPDARGHQIIPYDHFINNDLEYLKEGSSSHKYTTSITKAKAADYGHVKWIEDKIPRSIWSEIMEFFGYKHLEEITVRRQDDVLYKFREGNFKRLHREDIEDMLLLLVQGKLTNLNVDERFALNVALRMYMRRIVIQERVEDLQLAVENDMDRNRLMSTDELHKFSDGTLNQVRTFLNDIPTGIQMEYLPKFYTSAGNHVKEILLKLNLPDHRKLKDGGEVKEFQRSFRHSDTERLSRSDEVLKLKNFKKDATLKLFKSTNQERYEHVGPEVKSSQDGKITRWRNEIILG
ncbi:hypothetical protein Tco_1133816 [Tanacetum coccineum]